MPIKSIKMDVMSPNTAAAPLSASKLFFTMMNPFASAKSAILHMKKKIRVTIPNT